MSTSTQSPTTSPGTTLGTTTSSTATSSTTTPGTTTTKTTTSGTTTAGAAPAATGRPTLREALAARRSRRAARLRLERDLATYRTPAERHEIEAIVARYDGAGTGEVESILAAQAVARLREERHPYAVAR